MMISFSKACQLCTSCDIYRLADSALLEIETNSMIYFYADAFEFSRPGMHQCNEYPSTSWIFIADIFDAAISTSAKRPPYISIMPTASMHFSAKNAHQSSGETSHTLLTPALTWAMSRSLWFRFKAFALTLSSSKMIMSSCIIFMLMTFRTQRGKIRWYIFRIGPNAMISLHDALCGNDARFRFIIPLFLLNTRKSADAYYSLINNSHHVRIFSISALPHQNGLSSFSILILAAFHAISCDNVLAARIYYCFIIRPRFLWLMMIHVKSS